LFVIPIPTAPTGVDPIALTPQEAVERMIFKGKLDAYVKLGSILEHNVQKAYSLILGQSTDLLQSKLKQQSQWATISTA
jgi:hypothetical protein